jgi:uncharacterized protein (UPF0335 family)
MLSELLFYSRQLELELAARTIVRRQELECVQKVERLERELARAKARVTGAVLPARAT